MRRRCPNEINTTNVSRLRVVSTFPTGVERGHEAAPIVVGGTMYVVTPFPNFVYALDLTKPGLPIKWRYDPKPEAASQGVACCDVVNRGAVYDGGKIFFNTLDDHTIALDAATGKPVWDTKVGDIQIGETITMAPLVVKGRVLVGDSGGEMGVRGWLKGLDENSGKVVWTAYHTGPDKDVLIGPSFKAFYAKDRGKDLGVSSWPPDMWKIGGGTMWGWISYDPTLDLVYYGSANPGPWNPDVRPGDNKWTTTIFARRPETGEALWAYQITPHDVHDYDGINEQILIDLSIGGRIRHVLVRPERNGYIYVIDRATGEVISAQPYGFVNSSSGVDLKTGVLTVNPEKAPAVGKVVRDICPAAPGMKDWQPSAYSPRTGLLYLPHKNLCMDEEGLAANYIAKKASRPGLKRAFTEHERKTRGHVTRLERIFKDLEERPGGKKCHGMEGVLEEGKELIKEKPEPDVLDAGMISTAQHVEHYEMAGYGTVRTYARQLGLDRHADLLQQTLDEEEAADEILTQLAERAINLEAAGVAD